MESDFRQYKFKQLLARLLKGPVYPEQEFVCNRASFADIYSMASKFYLRLKEIEDKKVPVCLAAADRSTIAAALLASLASGNILALPHSFSAATLEQMQNATGYQLAIVDKGLKRDLPANTRLLSLESMDNTESPGFASEDISVHTTWLLLFTGGSTGTPKIWSKTAGNMLGEALFMASRFSIDTSDTIVATVTPYHIYGLLFSVLLPLVASARVLGETPSFPAEIAKVAHRESATIFASVPAHYRVLRGRRITPSLRLAFSSAGMLEEEDNEGFCQTNKIGIVEVYGSTETGGLATRDRSDGQNFFTPLSPVKWQIKEERLYVRSPFLSPDLPMDENNFFLSGDRVQSRGENEFSLHGRADSIAKVGGERVDLDEIRDLLQGQPNVKECVVMALVDGSGRGNRIAALVRGHGIDLKQIKKSLAFSLEPAALPKRIKKVDYIPVTANGKYDREKIQTLLSE